MRGHWPRQPGSREHDTFMTEFAPLSLSHTSVLIPYSYCRGTRVLFLLKDWLPTSITPCNVSSCPLNAPDAAHQCWSGVGHGQSGHPAPQNRGHSVELESRHPNVLGGVPGSGLNRSASNSHGDLPALSTFASPLLSTAFVRLITLNDSSLETRGFNTAILTNFDFKTCTIRQHDPQDCRS